MPKAKTGSVPGTSTKAVEAKVKTEAAKADTGFIPVERIIEMMIGHNCTKDNVDGFNPNVIYAVLVLDRFNFVNEYTTFERSYLISSSSPFFKCRYGLDFHAKKDREGNPVSPEIYGDCLDKTLDQGVRLDWYKWVYDGGYFYDPVSHSMLQYDEAKQEVKPLSKKTAKITEQAVHEALLASRLGPAYRELRDKKANVPVIDAGITALVTKLEGQKGAELDSAALKAVLDGLSNLCEEAAKKREAEAKAEENAKPESKKAPAEAAESQYTREPKLLNLVKLIQDQHGDKLLPWKGNVAIGKANVQIAKKFVEAMIESGKTEITDEDVAECALLVVQNGTKMLEAEKAKNAKSKKAEPKAEKPEGEKAKSKGPAKTSKPTAKPAQGKAPSFPVPVKRGKK